MDVTKWEYKSLNPSKNDFDDVISLMGQNGWEAVAMKEGRCLLKRPCGRIHVEEVEVNLDQSKLIYPDK